MPPKKVQEPERKPLIGRVGTNLRVGIVGVPNVGKSTFFNVLTKSAVAAENFPFCTIDPNENKEDDELKDLKVDQTVLLKTNCLKHFTIPPQPTGPFRSIDSYQASNSYYVYLEDTDAYERATNLFPPVCLSTESILGTNDVDVYPYSERAIQQKYLSSNPVSFLILGKPGIGEKDLGRMLADYWNCVYIHPESLIEEEIESGSRAGECIEFNLRCGRAIGVDILLKLVEKRVRTKTAAHRGFVICGFPMVANDLYDEDPVSSESAVFNVHDIFEDLFATAVEIGVPPEDVKVQVSKTSKFTEELGAGEAVEGEQVAEESPEGKEIGEPIVEVIKEPVDVGSGTDKVCVAPDISLNYDEQINFLYSLLEPPFVTIYVTCCNADVISKRNSYRFNTKTGKVVNLQNEEDDTSIYTMFSKEARDLSEVPEDFLGSFPINEKVDPMHLEYLVRLPRDFTACVAAQLEHYRFGAFPAMEKHILMSDPRYILKLDGRLLPIRMFNGIKMKLRHLPIQRVLVPQKFKMQQEVLGGEGVQIKSFNTEGMLPEEFFEEFKSKEIVHRMFKYTWSDWGEMCPVSMKEGSYLTGSADYGVHFMNKIFFLSNEEALKKFIRNPRPYLLDPYPKPSCKIIVMGPKYSGKTAVSKALSYLLDSEIISPYEINHKYLGAKKQMITDQRKSEAITEIMVKLEKDFQIESDRLEEECFENIQQWKDYCLQIIREYLQLIEDNEVSLAGQAGPIAISEETISNETYSDLSSGEGCTCIMYEEILQGVKTEIEEKGLIADDLEVLKDILESPDFLDDYVPNELYYKPSLYIAPNVYDPVVVEYVDNIIKELDLTGLELTHEDILNMYQNAIKDAEDKNVAKGGSRGGWIIDGFPADVELLEQLGLDFVDDVFILNDQSDNYSFLENRFRNKGTNNYKNFRKLFLQLGNMDAAFRAPTLSTDSYKRIMTVNILDSILDDLPDATESFRGEMNEEYWERRDEEEYFAKNPKTSTMNKFKGEISQFYNNFNTMKTLFEESNTTVTSITIDDKSLHDVLVEAVHIMQNRYSQKASPFTPDDRVQEVEDFGEKELIEPMGEEAGEGEEGGIKEDLFFQNRRFGDTFNYCPVTFHDHWVLWRGKEEYGAKYENKLYFMSDESCLEKFLAEPSDYLIKTKPPDKFPPPRICIIGPTGSGKTLVSSALSRNLGLYYYDFERNLKNSLMSSTQTELDNYASDDERQEDTNILAGYLKRGETLPEDFYRIVFDKLWFNNPIKKVGFVLDNFPKRPSDIDNMAKLYAIPDIIIELNAAQEIVHERLKNSLLEKWKIEKDREDIERLKKYHEQLYEYEVVREEKFKEMMDQKRQERYAQKLLEKGEVQQDDPTLGREGNRMEDIKEADEETDTEGPPIKPQISFESVVEEADIREINQVLDSTLAEPEYYPDEETIEEATERIMNEIQGSYDSDMEFMTVLREHAEAEQIPWTVVNANLPLDKVFAQAMRACDKVKFSRGKSLFERCYDITLDMAEKLLEQGYFFLSDFGRFCPVQCNEKFNPIQVFLPMAEQSKLFCVIHRQYIYFLAGKKNHDKFVVDPLKYVMPPWPIKPFLIPFKIGIIGPPKSGKTTLSNRFRRDLGLKVVTLGKSIRYVLQYLPKSSLAENLKGVLQNGWEVTNEMAIKCAEAMCLDGRAARRVPVPDERFEYLCEYFKPLSKVPAFLNVVDIAGLVKGASEGQGLGNAFLSHISACDAIFHMCRAFEDDDVTHVEGDVNPVRDLEIIAEELRLKDEETLMKNLEKLEKTVGRGSDKKLKPEYDTLIKIKGVLVDQKQHIRFSDWNANDIEILNKYLFLTSKPALYLVNLTEKDYIKKKNKWLAKIKEWIDKNDPGSPIIPYSAAFEHKLVEIEDPVLRKKYCEDNGTSSALDKIIVQGYKALQLEYFFTAGHDEVKAWTIQKGTKAPQAAGRIHTDFEKGFIMAEVMKFIDFKEEGSEAAAKAAGKYRQQGRNYVVEDGDIIFFKFNAGAGLKDAKKK